MLEKTAEREGEEEENDEGNRNKTKDSRRMQMIQGTCSGKAVSL